VEDRLQTTERAIAIRCSSATVTGFRQPPRAWHRGSIFGIAWRRDASLIASLSED
jgi:hypothetical protein